MSAVILVNRGVRMIVGCSHVPRGTNAVLNQDGIRIQCVVDLDRDFVRSEAPPRSVPLAKTEPAFVLAPVFCTIFTEPPIAARANAAAGAPISRRGSRASSNSLPTGPVAGNCETCVQTTSIVQIPNKFYADLSVFPVQPDRSHSHRISMAALTVRLYEARHQ